MVLHHPLSHHAESNVSASRHELVGQKVNQTILHHELFAPDSTVVALADRLSRYPSIPESPGREMMRRPRNWPTWGSIQGRHVHIIGLDQVIDYLGMYPT